MKTRPFNFLKSERKKTQYTVTIEDSTYTTYSYTEEGARSNAAYRYAEENDEEVALVMYQIKRGELYCKVEEG